MTGLPRLPDPGEVLDALNPFSVAGDVVAGAAADGWTGIMLTIWSAGLWALRFVLNLMDQFLTPDLSATGPAAGVYRTTFWIASTLVVVLAVVQIGVAVFRRDGRSLARVLLGGAQFVGVWACWVTYGTAMVAACGGLTRALMSSMLRIDSWAEWDPFGDFDVTSASIEVALATVLGFLGLFLWVAAIGHFVVMIARGVALLVLATTAPIAAAGLVSEVGQSWFWKSVRWFHAAALTPVLTVLVMGLGVQITTGTGATTAEGGSAEAAIGTAFPAVMMILVSVAAPVALFRLLAFVDPGTSSGAAMRAGLASAGGVGGLLTGGSTPGSGAPGPSSATAMSPSAGGRSQGEESASDTTSSKLTGALAAMTGVYGKGLQAVMGAGAQAAAVGADELNQTSVGDQSYFPDSPGSPQRFNPDQRDLPADQSGDDDPTGPGRGGPAMPTNGAAGGTGGAGNAVSVAADVPPVV